MPLQLSRHDMYLLGYSLFLPQIDVTHHNPVGLMCLSCLLLPKRTVTRLSRSLYYVWKVLSGTHFPVFGLTIMYHAICHDVFSRSFQTEPFRAPKVALFFIMASNDKHTCEFVHMMGNEMYRVCGLQ